MGALDEASQRLGAVQATLEAVPIGPTAENLIGDSHIVEMIAQIDQAISYIHEIGGPAEAEIASVLAASKENLLSAQGKLVSAADDMTVAHQMTVEASNRAQAMRGRLQ